LRPRASSACLWPPAVSTPAQRHMPLRRGGNRNAFTTKPHLLLHLMSTPFLLPLSFLPCRPAPPNNRSRRCPLSRKPSPSPATPFIYAGRKASTAATCSPRTIYVHPPLPIPRCQPPSTSPFHSDHCAAALGQRAFLEPNMRTKPPRRSPRPQHHSSTQRHLWTHRSVYSVCSRLRNWSHLLPMTLPQVKQRTGMIMMAPAC
jgi:hypothetical protein